VTLKELAILSPNARRDHRLPFQRAATSWNLARHNHTATSTTTDHDGFLDASKDPERTTTRRQFDVTRTRRSRTASWTSWIHFLTGENGEDPEEAPRRAAARRAAIVSIDEDLGLDRHLTLPGVRGRTGRTSTATDNLDNIDEPEGKGV